MRHAPFRTCGRDLLDDGDGHVDGHGDDDEVVARRDLDRGRALAEAHDLDGEAAVAEHAREERAHALRAADDADREVLGARLQEPPLLEARCREQAREDVANDVVGHAGLLGAREEIVEVSALALAVERRQILLGLHARHLTNEAHAIREQADELLIGLRELFSNGDELRRRLGRHRRLLYASARDFASSGPVTS